MKFVAVFIFLIYATAASAQITIHRNDADIQHRTFDRDHPPADMPVLHGNEAAITQTYFAVRARVGGEVTDQNSDTSNAQASVKIDSIDMSIELHVTVWVPSGAEKKIVDHEEGHRQISEYFYADSQNIAQRQATAMLGRNISAHGEDSKAAANAALKQAADTIGGLYLSQTDGPCAKAQETYDRVTAHGTNDVLESRAVRVAIQTSK